MTIKQQGGIFGRNPTFNNVGVTGSLTGISDLSISGNLIVANGKGIDFSATSGTGTSELFDDYEEGTFTPVVADAASGGNVATASSAYGYYTKVGRVVTVTIDLQNINTTGLTSGNDIFITGLPFLAASLTGNINYTAPVNGGGTLTSAKSVIAVVYDNNDYIRLVDAVSVAVTGWLDVSEINSGATDFRFSVTYFA